MAKQQTPLEMLLASAQYASAGAAGPSNALVQAGPQPLDNELIDQLNNLNLPYGQTLWTTQPAYPGSNSPYAVDSGITTSAFNVSTTTGPTLALSLVAFLLWIMGGKK